MNEGIKLQIFFSKKVLPIKSVFIYFNKIVYETYSYKYINLSWNLVPDGIHCHKGVIEEPFCLKSDHRAKDVYCYHLYTAFVRHKGSHI